MAVIESKGDGYALYNGVKVLASEVPEGDESISLDGMIVIEWDGDTTGLNMPVNYWYHLADITNIDINKECVNARMTGVGLTYSNQLLNKNDLYYGLSTARVVLEANETYPYVGLYGQKRGASSFVLFAYYPIEEEVTLPEWTSGDGWVLFDGLKLPALNNLTGVSGYPDDYAVIGYSESRSRYELFLSPDPLEYGEITYTGEMGDTATVICFINPSDSYVAKFHQNGNAWEYEYQRGGSGNARFYDFTIEETVWSSYDILDYKVGSVVHFSKGKTYDLTGHNVLEWDGKTNGLTVGSIIEGYNFSNCYRVSDAILPALTSGKIAVNSVIAEIVSGELHHVETVCFAHPVEGLWSFYDLAVKKPVYYSETAINGLPEAGLYLYNDGSDRATLFAIRVNYVPSDPDTPGSTGTVAEQLKRAYWQGFALGAST